MNVQPSSWGGQAWGPQQPDPHGSTDSCGSFLGVAVPTLVSFQLLGHKSLSKPPEKDKHM